MTYATALALAALATTALACSPAPDQSQPMRTETQGAPQGGGIASVKDDGAPKDVVKIAAGSKDHTTLVAAVKAANLLDVLAGPGPYTVFAPTDAAFAALPAGTVESLLEPANVSRLKAILYHHTITSSYDIAEFEDGQELPMLDGARLRITKQGGDTYIDGKKIVASVKASNGMVHVIDGVMVPAN
jgi:uncharacterized surface protein with fasciclin (FAS1) repeats